MDWTTSTLSDSDVADEQPPANSVQARGTKRRQIVGVVGSSTTIPDKTPKKPGSQKKTVAAAPQMVILKEEDGTLDKLELAPESAPVLSVARKDWVGKVLPTLVHCLFTSDDPFGSQFSKDPLFVAIAQTCLDYALPMNTYQIQENDTIFSKANAIIIDHRSKIGRFGVKYVSTYLNALPPSKRKAYVKWALHNDGPALYKQHVPQFCTIDPDDIDYPTISGFGETDAFKEVFGKAAKNILNSSCGPWGEAFTGAFILSAASIRRAFRLWETGAYIAPDKLNEFSATNPQVQDDIAFVIDSAKKLSARAWRRIHTNAGTEVTSQTKPAPAAPSMQRRVARLPDSSPAPDEID
ncbi:hypothetical protein CYLTODRAFT_170771 [Cylindrobasidium torrendii FP15055 ss-10]|uniref:Uncharacterized protein n=1 Tax=Cylindrobasidium torrendii FP15055 ss-10 TaxID=1314674 RepID=A0A0D7AWH6_9AGAR|nr:hypothetical protein CYLTODRAFT_170771 [Cylindrobasidium torrendii FP15055 ss-10]